MQQRTSLTLVSLAALLCALAVFLYLRASTPPAIARLLPEADAIAFFNLQPLRAATHFDRSTVTRSPSYQQFVDRTGILPERDLDQAAFALHHMPDPNGPNGPVAFSEVVRGRFDSPRLTRYLASLATSQELYAGRTIFLIPSEGRSFRVALLDRTTIAASNAPTPEQIHTILEHQRSFRPSGPSLLVASYPALPLLASAWAIGQIGLPFAQKGRITLLGLELPLPANSEFVASLRPAPQFSLHSAAPLAPSVLLEIDQLTGSQAQAAESVQSLNTLLNLLRSLQPASQSVPSNLPNTSLRQIIDSVTIVPSENRAILTATLPTQSLKQLSAP